MSEPSDFAAALIESRRTVLPKRLVDPGPSEVQLNRIAGAAAHAPDHDCLLPWRFVIVPRTERARLADAFELSLMERDPGATGEQRARAREKAFRAPVLMLAIARLEPDSRVPDAERILSAGCAIQNMLLMATALGFASALTSGKALHSTALRELFALGSHEKALCFISVGTALAARRSRERAQSHEYVTALSHDQPASQFASACVEGGP